MFQPCHCHTNEPPNFLELPDEAHINRFQSPKPGAPYFQALLSFLLHAYQVVAGLQASSKGWPYPGFHKDWTPVAIANLDAESSRRSNDQSRRRLSFAEGFEQWLNKQLASAMSREVTILLLYLPRQASHHAPKRTNPVFEDI